MQCLFVKDILIQTINYLANISGKIIHIELVCANISQKK